MPHSHDHLLIPTPVRRALYRVRQRIRLYVGVEGVAILTMVVATLFWLSLLFDRLLEPSVETRLVALVVVGACLLGVAYRYLFRRLTARISDRSLALLLERHHRQLGDRVATIVSVASEEEAEREYHAELVSRTASEAAKAIRGVSTGSFFNLRPLFRTVVVALLLATSIAIFALTAGETFGFWIQRIALSAERWPRRVSLEVVGFKQDAAGKQTAKLARHDDFEFLARAKITGDWLAPDRVVVHYRLPDGRRGKDYLTRVGDALPGRDEFQTYRYTFKRVREDLRLELVGGDDRIRDLMLLVVDRPELVQLEIDCVYPGYLARGPRTLAVTSGQRIPVGTRVVVRAKASKQLAEVKAHSELGILELTELMDAQPTDELQIEYGELLDNDVVFLMLRDTDGITSREPYRVALSAVSDELPQVAVNVHGIGSAITPDAQIPFSGEVADDYGLNQVWFDYSVDGGTPQKRLFAVPPGEYTKWELSEAFDLRVRQLSGQEALPRLEPGQQLVLAALASDQCDLRDTPQFGSSQRFLLDVVTPSDLLQLLEQQELTLRQRYEATVEKIADTRSLLARVEFPESADSASEEAADPPTPDVDEASQALGLRKLRIAGAHQNVMQSADEVLATAAGFENIHDQLINNRIENEELRSRLKEQIANPLRHIGTNRMPSLQGELKTVEALVADSKRGGAALTVAIKTTDAILVEMRYVLERMLELETYNEVVAMLRGIISDQGELNENTKRRRQQSLRSLLDD